MKKKCFKKHFRCSNISTATNIFTEYFIKWNNKYVNYSYYIVFLIFVLHTCFNKIFFKNPLFSRG